jgi:hypothetical protein
MQFDGANYEFDWSRELNQGEKLLWSGQPPQGIRFRWTDLIFVPFGCVFMLGPLAGVIAAINQQGPEAAFMLLFITPFVLIGGFLAFGRFFVEKMQRGQNSLRSHRRTLAHSLRSLAVPAQVARPGELERHHIHRIRQRWRANHVGQCAMDLCRAKSNGPLRDDGPNGADAGAC